MTRSPPASRAQAFSIAGVRPPPGDRAANSGQRAPVPDLVKHETPSGILLYSTVRAPAGRLVKPSRPAVRVQHPQSRLIEARVAERRQHGIHQLPPQPLAPGPGQKIDRRQFPGTRRLLIVIPGRADTGEADHIPTVFRDERPSTRPFRLAEDALPDGISLLYLQVVEILLRHQAAVGRLPRPDMHDRDPHRILSTCPADVHSVRVAPRATARNRFVPAPRTQATTTARSGLSSKRCNFCLCCLLPSRAETAVEGDVEGVEGGLPPVGPPLAALPGRVQAHDRHIEALHGGLLGREMPAGVHSTP